jgi:hypothetical protein
LREAENARDTSVKALNEAKRERVTAYRALQQSAEADAKREKEEKARLGAEEKAKRAKWSEEATKSRYMALFIGIVIFTIVIAILNAYSRRSVLVECGAWFVDRFDGLVSILSWIKSTYIACAEYFSGLFGIHAAWGLIIAIVIYLIVVAAGVVGIVVALVFLLGKIDSIREQYILYGEYKAMITASIAISLFYVCLFCYDAIKSAVSLNIFTVWLLMSLISSVLINLKEIVGGLKRGY